MIRGLCTKDADIISSVENMMNGGGDLPKGFDLPLPGQPKTPEEISFKKKIDDDVLEFTSICEELEKENEDEVDEELEDERELKPEEKDRLTGLLTRLQACVERRKELYTESSYPLGEVYHRVADVQWKLNDIPSAKDTMELYIENLREHNVGDFNPLQFSIASKNLAECYQSISTETEDEAQISELLDKALPHMEQAVVSIVAHFDSPQFRERLALLPTTEEELEYYGSCLTGYSELLMQADRHEEAIEHLENLMAFLEEAKDSQNKEALLDKIVCLGNIASCFRALGDEEKIADTERRIEEYREALLADIPDAEEKMQEQFAHMKKQMDELSEMLEKNNPRKT